MSGQEDEYEIILVNDGSPDGCGTICDEYAQKYTHIKTIHQDNAGVSIARNVGVKSAVGEYVTFFDPDDWVTDDLEKLISEIKASPKYDIYQTGWQAVDTTDMIVNIKMPQLTEGLYDNLCDINCWSKVYKASFLADHDIIFMGGRLMGEDFLHSIQGFCFCTSYKKLNLNYYRHLYNRKTSIMNSKNIKKTQSMMLNGRDALELISRSHTNKQVKKHLKYILSVHMYSSLISMIVQGFTIYEITSIYKQNKELFQARSIKQKLFRIIITAVGIRVFVFSYKTARRGFNHIKLENRLT
jgi:glycosyltransferase involved in cell wall biosynthesis